MTAPPRGPAGSGGVRAGSTGRRRRQSAPLRLATLAVLLLVGGCSRGSGSLQSFPLPIALPLHTATAFSPTLGEGDLWLRYLLTTGRPDSAVRVTAPGRNSLIGDPLLRSLQLAVAQRQAREFPRSNELLDWAEREAERRSTRSLSRTAASYLVTERARSYVPTRLESVMIPFYRMLNHLDLRDPGAAAVEARRISFLLADDRLVDTPYCGIVGTLHYLAGLAFEAAGEVNDATVSLRRAEASFDGCRRGNIDNAPPGFGRDLYRVAIAAGIEEVADSASRRYPDTRVVTHPDSAEVIVIAELGFVAHRAEEAVLVPILEGDVRGAESGQPDAISAVAAAISLRLTRNHAASGQWGVRSEERGGPPFGYPLEDSYLLRLVWPRIEVPRRAVGVTRVDLGGRIAMMTPTVDLSAAVEADLDRERSWILTRMVSRGLTKFIAARALERKAEAEGGEVMGLLAGRLANLAANELERADTRSWTLLPDEIAVARINVAPGLNVVRLISPAGGGHTEEELEIQAGERRLIPLRLLDALPTAP